MSLQSLPGIELSSIQAPMAGVQGSALAVAVSNLRTWTPGSARSRWCRRSSLR
jgi:hypothetical protein